MLTALDEATYGNEQAERELRNMRGLLLWALYHHQGRSSTIGQPIRKALGIGEYAAMTPVQIKEAQIAGADFNKGENDGIHGKEQRALQAKHPRDNPQALARLRLRNNPDNKPTGAFTGRCPHCGSDNLWDDNLIYGCNSCGAMLGGN